MTHLTEHALRRFVAGRTSRQENRQIVAHLLRGCDSCAALAKRVWYPIFPEQAYHEVLDGVEKRFVARFGEAHLPVFQRTSAPRW